MRMKTLLPMGLAIMGCVFLGCSVQPSSSGGGGSAGSGGTAGSGGVGGGAQDSDCATLCAIVIDCGLSDDGQAECESSCERAQAEEPEDFNEAVACLDEHLIVGECDAAGFEACTNQVTTCQHACLRITDCGALGIEEISVEGCTRNGPVCDELADCTRECEEEFAEEPQEVQRTFACIEQHLTFDECNLEAFNACVPFFTGINTCDDACEALSDCGLLESSLDECLVGCENDQIENPGLTTAVFECIEDYLGDGLCEVEGFELCSEQVAP